MDRTRREVLTGAAAVVAAAAVPLPSPGPTVDEIMPQLGGELAVELVRVFKASATPAQRVRDVHVRPIY
jgi:hypothetical protein